MVLIIILEKNILRNSPSDSMNDEISDSWKFIGATKHRYMTYSAYFDENTEIVGENFYLMLYFEMNLFFLITKIHLSVLKTIHV